MNWLAHIFLSEDHVEYQLGNLLADLLKGKSWQGASQPFNNGMAMHRAIDRFTDQHPSFMRSQSRLGPRGRLRGVVIDIVYDHLLVKNWSDYATTPFEAFVTLFHRRSRSAYQDYPEKARAFVSKLVASGHLRHYAHIAGLETALHRIDRRLSPRVLARESASEYIPRLDGVLGDIERDFRDFMPDIIEHVRISGAVTGQGHWLK